MRIGLVGGMANAMYCFTRVLRQQGYDAHYVEDRQDTFPMAQPLWEEVPLTLEWPRFGSEPLDLQGWRDLGESCGWRRPSWVVDPKDRRLRTRLVRRSRIALHAGRRGSKARLAEIRTFEPMIEQIASAPLVEELSSYDRLVVCGIRAVEALLSGRPYVYWPHGGDVNIVPFQGETAVDRAFARLLPEAVVRAETAGTHDPSLAARLEEFGRPSPIPYLPFLVDVDRYAPGMPTTKVAQGVQARAGDRRVLLLASRQDFFWKGTDRFARAFAATVAAGAPLFLVVPPWGADVEQTRAIFAEGGVLDSVHYLDSAVSKPILRDLFRLADLVVDQFTLTSFGALMLEAMACGAPVMINLDLEAFRSRWPNFVPPPVLRASDEGEIAAALRAVSDGAAPLDEIKRAGIEWIREHHGPDAARLYVGEAR